MTSTTTTTMMTMARRQKQNEEEEAAAAVAAAARARADPHLAAMPEELKKREQDTELEPSWVTGILEVPLSMEQKLANIEAVEAAKNRLLAAADPEEQGAGQPGAVRRIDGKVVKAGQRVGAGGGGQKK